MVPNPACHFARWPVCGTMLFSRDLYFLQSLFPERHKEHIHNRHAGAARSSGYGQSAVAVLKGMNRQANNLEHSIKDISDFIPDYIR